MEYVLKSIIVNFIFGKGNANNMQIRIYLLRKIANGRPENKESLEPDDRELIYI